MKSLVVIFLILISSYTFSQEEAGRELRVIEIRLSHQNSTDRILLGAEEPVKMELSAELPIHLFQMLVNDKFIFDDGVYLSQVKELASTKPGFSQVFEGRAGFTKPIIPNTKYKLELAQMGVQLQFINLNIEVFNDREVSQAKSPQVVNQNLNSTTSYILEIMIAVFMMIVIVFIWLVYNQKKNSKSFSNQQRKELYKLIKNAKTRKDFELLYANSEKMRDVFEFDKKYYGLFREIVFRNQYKREWESELINNVQDAHKKMLRSINQRGDK